MSILEHALQYADRGWSVFPVYGIENGQCTCGNSDCSSAGKHPMTSGGCKDASIDPAQVNEWWRCNPKANIGIATGQVSGLVVIDVDDGVSKQGFESLQNLETRNEPLPRDFVVRTGGGGLHIYLAAPENNIRNSAGKIAPNIDVRGDGGYVVAPPSLHISGKAYTWEMLHA